MPRFPAVLLVPLLLAAASEGQLFPPPFPPLGFIPQFDLQAANTGGFRAYLPDPCGSVERVKFDWRRSGVEDWSGGFLPAPLDPGLWVYDAPGAGLSLGQPIFFRAQVFGPAGVLFQQPETPWTVTDLVETFSPPSGPPPAKICEGIKPTTPSTTTTTTEEPTKPTEDTTEEGDESSTKGEEAEDRVGSASTTTKKPAKKKPEKEKPEKEKPEKEKPEKENKLEEEWGPPLPSPSPPPPPGLLGPQPGGPCATPWLLEPFPGDTKEALLEKELTRMRCDINRYSLLSQALYQELTDLKKLNYAMVARMQRLESILRTAPPFQSPWLG